MGMRLLVATVEQLPGCLGPSYLYDSCVTAHEASRRFVFRTSDGRGDACGGR